MSKIYEAYQDEQMEKFLTEEEEFTQGMIIQNMIQEDDKAIVYPVSLQDGIITDGNGDVAHLTEDNQIQFHV